MDYREEQQRNLTGSPSGVVTGSPRSGVVTESPSPVVTGSPSRVVASSPSHVPVVDSPSEVANTHTTPPPVWLLEKMGEVNGYDPKVIMERKFTKNDVSVRQGQLLIPISQLLDSSFLEDTERTMLDTQTMAVDFKSEVGLRTSLYRNSSSATELFLQKRLRNGVWDFVLNRGWNKVLKNYKLVAGSPFRLWSFRSLQSEGSILCFGLDYAVPENSDPVEVDDPAEVDLSIPNINSLEETDDLSLPVEADLFLLGSFATEPINIRTGKSSYSLSCTQAHEAMHLAT
ncbi:PREDICTED: B3 domain-containing protein At2g31420-like [Camelina sativa]|uniref:B3 domain-containing protein At2g31420-like n=1 Tax=Camelina sativa TaxID=90675 RepID=A0ABM0YXZ2_CAMSA|nr:PREDICTED: B3 domain-containing protein At2g31420-like [Camelina sativa]